MTTDDIHVICDYVSEAAAILHDHAESGRHTPAEALARLQKLLSEEALRNVQGRIFSGYHTARVSAQLIALGR
jgi:hypothetical protein